MAPSTANLIRGVRGLVSAGLDAGAAEMDAEAQALTAQLRASSPHGIDTGATDASLTVARVGRGESGAAALSAAVAAVEQHNPGHSATSQVAINGELGALAYSATDYQNYLETENAGQYAYLGPFVPTMGERMTRAFSRGSKRRLGG